MNYPTWTVLGSRISSLILLQSFRWLSNVENSASTLYNRNVYFLSFIPTRSSHFALMSTFLVLTVSASGTCTSEQAHQGRLHLHVHDVGDDRYCVSGCGHNILKKDLSTQSPLCCVVSYINLCFLDFFSACIPHLVLCFTSSSCDS